MENTRICPPVIRLEILICPSAQWIEAVVHGKVSDFMIPLCCASMGFLEVGHLVVVNGGNLVVDTHELSQIQSCCQERPSHTELRIGAVNCSRYVIVVVNYVSGVKVAANVVVLGIFEIKNFVL